MSIGLVFGQELVERLTYIRRNRVNDLKCQKCIDKPKAKGLCKLHYERQRTANKPVCKVVGCTRRQTYVQTELCLAHHQQSPKGQNQKLKSIYGITFQQFTLMMELQNGVCAICKQPESRNQRLCVDHNHDTGEVRGLLCFACNAGIGFLQDSSDVLEKAKQYLKEKGK